MSGAGGLAFGLSPLVAFAEGTPGPGSAPKTLVVGWAAGPNGCDPEFNTAPGSLMIYRQCAGYAVQFGATKLGDVFQDNFSDLTPDDASNVEVSADGSKLTVTLKEGVKSPAGNEMTADDVVYRYQRNWALRGSQWGFVKDAMLLTEDSVKKESRYVYSITMTGPNAIAKTIQAHVHAGIFDSVELKKHSTKEDPWSTKWLGSHYAGFGPWALTDYVPGESWTFERNPNYYNKAAYTGNVTKIVHKVIPSSQNRVALLEAGAIDIAFDLQASELVRLTKTAGVRVDKFDGNYAQWLGFSFDTEAGKPLRDVNVRKAIGLVLPFDQLLQRPYLGLASQLKSTVAPSYPGYDKTSAVWARKQDVAAAKALIAKSGYPDGFSTTLHYDIGQAGQEESAIIIKAALAELKITVQIIKVQTGDFFNLAFTRGKGFPGLFIYKDMAGTPDVNFGTHLWLKSGHCCAPGGYGNATIDGLYKEAQSSVNDLALRIDHQVKIDNIALNDDPMGVPMQQLGFYGACRANVGGYWWHSLNEIGWERAWKA